MTVLGYWTSQEQYSMQDLLEFVNEAEKGGFTSVLTSDHFHPWWHDNGFGNFTWYYHLKVGSSSITLLKI